YGWIFAIQAIAYYGKLAIHPGPLTSLSEVWERAAIGPIPGTVVVLAGVIFHASWAVFAYATWRIELADRRERKSLIAMGLAAHGALPVPAICPKSRDNQEQGRACRWMWSPLGRDSAPSCAA